MQKTTTINLIVLGILIIAIGALSFQLYQLRERVTNQIETEIKNLTQQVDSLNTVEANAVKNIKTNTAKAKTSNQTIDQKLKTDEKIISNSSVNDSVINAFLAKHGD